MQVYQLQRFTEHKHLLVLSSKSYLEPEDCLESGTQLFTVYIPFFWQFYFSFLHLKKFEEQPHRRTFLIATGIYSSLGAYISISSKILAACLSSARDMTDSADLMIKQSHYDFKYIAVATWICCCLLLWMTVLTHGLHSVHFLPWKQILL